MAEVERKFATTAANLAFGALSMGVASRVGVVVDAVVWTDGRGFC